ncbi:hypothetical protein HZA55_08910 [Candidatus Poribacteria bacterium]|nr:hypothetical protein [Candidatus Poribacteria bacterium]
MTRPLNVNESQTINHVLNFFYKLLERAESINPNEINKYYIDIIKKEIDGLSDVLKKGQIDIESFDLKEIRAKSDIKGIHINDKQNILSMSGEIQLNNEENIKSLWLIISILFHEKFHFERHTGLLKLLFKSPLELFIGSGMLIFSTAINKKTFRTLLWKEYQACAHAYLVMQKIGYLLVDVNRVSPNVFNCFEEHLKWHREFMERQNPWSKYGLK